MATKQHSLLSSLVATDTKKRKKGQVTFKTAMTRMGIHSVFDIVRLSKADFVRQLAKLSGVDGDLAYTNAQAYATLLARLRREQLTSSGTYEPQVEHSGVRALVPLGPTYPKLFNENWSKFCKVGALAADDSPVAYLSALRVFVQQLESTSNDPKRLLLDSRRPDLKDLLITHESTFTPRPMLKIVNQVLGDNLSAYLKTQPADASKPLYQVLSERQYPFELPYNFYHHQCQLGLSGGKPRLGELNYRGSYLLPITQADSNDYGKVQLLTPHAQHLLTGLGPEQQKLLIASPAYSTFYLNRADLVNGWKSPGNCHLSPHVAFGSGYLLPAGQPDVGTSNPPVTVLTNAHGGAGSSNTVAITFRKAGGASSSVNMRLASGAAVNNNTYLFNHLHLPSQATHCIHVKPTTGLPAATETGYTATFKAVHTTGTVSNPVSVARRTLTLSADAQYAPTTNEKAYFAKVFGMEITGPNADALADLDTFMQHTGLNAEQVEMLLSRHAFAVRLSPNCPSSNAQRLGLLYNRGLPFPHPNHYGACYVNGNGSDRFAPDTSAADVSRQYAQFENAMDLESIDIGERKYWHLTLTSLDRFDRLQRMIRLQRWTGIPFHKLDTLIMCAIRAEGATNLDMALNENTLRVLGVYRYLNQRHGIDPEEFGALMHHLTPYTNVKSELSLFDRVFNSIRLFETPLVLDKTAFTVADSVLANRITLMQLCAGLGLQLTQDSFLLIAAQTSRVLTGLKRDLATVSSLFRQARIARLFGCTVAELLTLANLLGGQGYKDVLAKGTLRPHDQTASPDILDVLMQLQWAMDWLHDSQQSITQLEQRLGPNIPLKQPRSSPGKLPTATDEPSPLTDALRARLSKLQHDTEFSRVTETQVLKLNLPTHNNANTVIRWFSLLTSWNVLNNSGLLVSLDESLALMDDPKGWIGVDLDKLLANVTLSAAAKQDSKDKLLAFLLDAHDRQLQLLQDLFQETAALPVDRTVAVIHWANTSPYAILVEALMKSALLVEHFQRVSRHAEIAVNLRLSNRALRMFLCNRDWLGGYPITNSEPTLSDLYLFERFSHWLNGQDQPEEALTSYFSLANPPSPKRMTKKLQLQISESANVALAKLLGWATLEVENLTATLPGAVAKSMQHVDWVRRCQAACNASGLSAKALLLATAITANSSLDNWKAVGEAVVTANTPSDTVQE